MSYITTIHARQQTVTIENATTITIAGVRYAIDWRKCAGLASEAGGQSNAGGRYSLLIAGQSYDVFARPLPPVADAGNGQTYEIQFAAQRFVVQGEDERSHLLAGLARGTGNTGAARIVAPMPGLVVNVLVSAGETIAAGQPVVILEAMKMENDLTAPISGHIQEVRVSKGQTVDQGEVLIVIEGEPA